MKRLILLSIIAGAFAGQLVDDSVLSIADKIFLEKQRDVLRLLNYVNQPSYYRDFVEIAANFKFDGEWDRWTKPQYAKEFYNYYQNNILPRGEIFSVFYPEHLKQAIALFRTFYYAKDYDTLNKTAVWARSNVNEGMFVYAYTVAVVHSKMTEDLVLPPIYEIYPNFFYNDEVMLKAQQYKQENNKDSTINANYSGSNMNAYAEQSMAYFTDDIGLNAYYYYTHVYEPFWMESEEINFGGANRGQHFYWSHQQLLARYYLERLSNGLGEIPDYSYDRPIETGYYPSLTYYNGKPFPSRENNTQIQSEQSNLVDDYERRLRSAFDKGNFQTPKGQSVDLFDKEGFENLANLVQHNADSLNAQYFGDLLMNSRHLLGNSNTTPSCLEHFETSMRDPMFYQLFKRTMDIFQQHQNRTGPYKKTELDFPGVEIRKLSVDRLITYFDYHYADLSRGVVVAEEELRNGSVKIRAQQARLNHKSFSYEIDVESENATGAIVKLFIGPKFDEHGREISIAENVANFFELDRFCYDLEAGSNVIQRNFHTNRYFSKDRTTYDELQQWVNSAFLGRQQFKYSKNALNYYGFPQRLAIPKGDFGGKTFQFYAIISPFHSGSKAQEKHSQFLDLEYSIGYPFDRPIEFENEFFVSNSIIRDVIIYHKDSEKDINKTN